MARRWRAAEQVIGLLPRVDGIRRGVDVAGGLQDARDLPIEASARWAMAAVREAGISPLRAAPSNRPALRGRGLPREALWDARRRPATTGVPSTWADEASALGGAGLDCSSDASSAPPNLGRGHGRDALRSGGGACVDGVRSLCLPRTRRGPVAGGLRVLALMLFIVED